MPSPAPPARLLVRLACLAGAGLALACGDASETGRPEAGQNEETAPEPAPPGPPGARWDVLETLRADREVVRHPSDGGGRVWLEAVEPERLVAARPGRFELVFEVGPLGIASGGMIYLQVSPFWEWSTPQTEWPDAPGFTRVESDAEDVELEAQTLDQQLLGIRVTGRALRAGERIHIYYGAGPAGAMTDAFADADSRLWIAVDGDGDGVRKVLADSPSVVVTAGPPARLRITLPTLARPDELVRVNLALLDVEGSAGVEFSGEVALEGAAPLLELPERVSFAAADAGVKVIEGRARGAGVVRVRAEAAGGLSAQSNPLLISSDGPRVLWGDLHGHSGLSDGTGTPEDYFRYARDVAGLDVAALTDHDHWGILPLVDRPENWQHIRHVVQRFNEPGHFVTLLGFEWTNWIYGHRHVLYFTDEGQVYDSVDPAFETPQQLWQALEGSDALTFAHHSAGDPVPTDWSIPPDPRFEPVTEVASVHGSSEAADAPQLIRGARRGNFVRDALDRGYPLGFIGSGDSHDGHPGLPQIASGTGGLAAILSEERTREGVRSALTQRRVYATNGPRMLLRTALGGHPMGSTIELGEAETLSDELFVVVIAEGPLERVDLVRSGALVDSMPLDGTLEASLRSTVSELRAGEYVYVRVVQQDGGAAWSSPIFVR